jgi:hypothetical protein
MIEIFYSSMNLVDLRASFCRIMGYETWTPRNIGSLLVVVSE